MFARTPQILTLCAALIAVPGSAPARADQPDAGPQPQTVFAAASLTEVVKELARDYEKRSGRRVRLSFASSSMLARQIENGAAVTVFISADEEWMRYLDDQRRVVRESWVRPIGNRLVLVAPVAATAGSSATTPVQDAGVAPLMTREFDLVAALGTGGRLAVGDPAHVPAGRYARQALEHLGLWQAVAPRLARAENVRAALALVERGEAPLGIVYASDVRAARGVRTIARFADSSHEPIRYSFALIAGKAGTDARALLAHLTNARALERYRAFGFVTD